MIKQRVRALLKTDSFREAFHELRQMPQRQVINSLFSFLYEGDQVLKWKSVTTMGLLVADLADKERESARVIIRRLMWNLNDESGGIGWGSSEAMGEILARHRGLAAEYAPMLISYVRKDGNYQENEEIQQGVLWAISRIAQENPNVFQDDAPHIMPLLTSENAGVRGHAARALGLLGYRKARTLLEKLMSDDAMVSIFQQESIVEYRVKDVAAKALEMVGV